MPLSQTAIHRMLNHLVGNAATAGPVTHASLHSANPPTAANEISGGSPAYARKAVTWEAVAGTETPGNVDMTAQPVFDVAGGTTVAAVGYWTALTGGTFMGGHAVTSETFAGQGTYTLTDSDIAGA